MLYLALEFLVLWLPCLFLKEFYMKNKGIVLLLIFVIGIVAVFSLTKRDETPKKRVAVGLEAPAFELKDTDGKTWRLSDLKGKSVILHFWASW